MASIVYRPDIDGLRAIAVGTVVLFHAQLGIFTGGFVGVDVFFVISGYLITSIIARELDNGTFSLLSFYERRIRRIFPALLVVIATCLAVGAWRMTPLDYERTAESALAAIGFHSNFYFSKEAGYFMPAAETLPLLHTWSLGVEEQFYVIAPLILIALWRFKSWLTPVFLALLVIAQVTSLWGTNQDAGAAFYLPHIRAIELLIGVVLAVGIVPAVRSRFMREALSGLGIALILLAASTYTSATLFPGVAALMPCIGAALVIHYAGGIHGRSFVGRLLSSTPAVGLGKISYSLYLWHWPLFALALYEWGELNVGFRIFLVLASVALAALTYRWVEQPARLSRQILTTPRVFAAGLGSAAVLALAAAGVTSTDGWPGRLNAAAAAFNSEASTRAYDDGYCVGRKRFTFESPCRLGDKEGPVRALMWGDSHAHTLAAQFDAVGKMLGIGVMMVSGPGCPPLLQTPFDPSRGRSKCQDIPSQVSEQLKKGSIRHVVMIARWAVYTGQPTLGPSGLRPMFRVTPDATSEAERSFVTAFNDTVSRLHDAGLRITVLGPVPELPVHLPTAMLKAYMRGKSVELPYNFAEFEVRQMPVLAQLAKAEKLPRVDVIYPDRILCPLGVCSFVGDGLPLYRDGDHLNARGGARLRPALTQSLSWLDRRKAESNQAIR